MKLYEINQALAERLTALGEMLENGETPSDDETRAILDLKGKVLSSKLVQYGFVVKNISAEIDALKGEIDCLSARKNSLAKEQERVKQAVLLAMIDNNINKIDDPIMPIRLQNSPKSVRLDILPSALPPEFQKVEISAKTTELKNALMDGIKIDGVTLVQNKHIRIGHNKPKNQ